MRKVILLILLFNIYNCSDSIKTFNVLNNFNVNKIKFKTVNVIIQSSSLGKEALIKLKERFRNYLQNRKQSEKLYITFNDNMTPIKSEGYLLIFYIEKVQKNIYRLPNESGIWDEERRELDHIHIEVEKEMKVKIQLSQIKKNTLIISSYANESQSNIKEYIPDGTYTDDGWFIYSDLEEYPLPEEPKNFDLFKKVYEDFIRHLEEMIQ